MKLHKFNWPVIRYQSEITGLDTEVQVEIEVSIPFDEEGFDFRVYDTIVQGKINKINDSSLQLFNKIKITPIKFIF